MSTRARGAPPQPGSVRRLVADFDPNHLNQAFYEDPYPTYRALRALDPVHRCPDGSFFLTRHADLQRIYRDHRTFSSDKTRQFRAMLGDSPLYEHHTTSLVFNDPPLHTHVRKAIGDALSHRTIMTMLPELRVLLDRLLDEIEDKGRFDLVADYASIVPIEVIGNLMGIPKEDRGRLGRWANAILGGLEFDLPDERREYGNQCVVEFLEYLEVLVSRRRRDLDDDQQDIISRLIRWESDGFRLSGPELYHQCIFLLNAGHETTTNLIANGLHALVTHPPQLEKLLAEPALIDSAIEELLRFESPVQLGNRMAVDDVAVGDARVPAGGFLTLCIGAANRDPDVYPDPDTLDIARHPRDHLAFAGGIHTCAGLHLARLEAKLAIPGLLKRFPALRLDGEPRRSQRARFRGFVSLPMHVH